MPDIFTPQGMSRLQRLAASSSLLAFDLDGTLAPIVPKPDDAAIPSSTAALLNKLADFWPLAIITGRSIDDAKKRLGFTPHYLYGNHGAECADAIMSMQLRHQLDSCRRALNQNSKLLGLHKIVVEDKGLSIALHYAPAVSNAHTRGWLTRLLANASDDIMTSHGHQVMNITPRHAPDKGDALLKIMRDCGACRALVMGDDINDECAFVKAPAESVTVRVGPSQIPMLAQFKLPSQLQVNQLLMMLVKLRTSTISSKSFALCHRTGVAAPDIQQNIRLPELAK